MLEQANGVYIVTQTPFDERGALDLSSIDSLVEFCVAHGANGFTVLGISGEASKLTADEAVVVSARFVARARSLPVIAGVSNPSLAQLVQVTRSVMDGGATGVMIAPPAGLRTEEDVYNYFDAVYSRIGEVPTVLQDYPAATGVAMSVATIARLVDAFPQIKALKHEDLPGLGKLTRLRQMRGRRTAILTGSNALYLPLELGRGADGPMAGFSHPEMLSGVYRLHCAGQRDAALDLFARYLPLLTYKSQGPWGIAVRKEVMRRRGAIRCALMRPPGPQLTSLDHAEIEMLLDRLARANAAVSSGAGAEAC